MAIKPKKPVQKRAPKASAIPAVPQAASYGYGGTQSSGTGYTAADNTTQRGYVYFPNIDSKTTLTPYARIETLRKARWLEGNMGLGRHFAGSIPRLVGPLIPQARTRDEKFNELAEAHFLRTQSSAMIHDQAGAEDFFTRQRTVVKRGIVDGDGLLIRTVTTTGNARTALYEGPQIGSAHNMTRENGWFDGVKMDKYNRKTDFAVLDPADRWAKEATVIRGRDAMPFGYYESPHAARGLTRFIHAINRLLDIREIDNDTIRGIKAANLVGFYVANSQIENATTQPAAGRMRSTPFFGTAPSSTTESADVKFEELTSGGGNLANLGIGQELKTIHDERRHPNQQAVIDYFIADCSWGLGFPPALLWSIASLTGPAVRFVMRMAEKTLAEYRASLKSQFCQPYWTYALALAQKNGTIPWCKDPDWWKCEWIAPSALTIDAGRDSAAGIREIQAGATTLASWYGEDGDDWQDALEQIARERAKVMELEKKYGLEPGAIMGERELNQEPVQTGPVSGPTK